MKHHQAYGIAPILAPWLPAPFSACIVLDETIQGNFKVQVHLLIYVMHIDFIYFQLDTAAARWTVTRFSRRHAVSSDSLRSGVSMKSTITRLSDFASIIFIDLCVSVFPVRSYLGYETHSTLTDVCMSASSFSANS